MLIIFDLDDTLVQTTQTLTPHLLRVAIAKMIAEGLPHTSLDESVRQVLRINNHASSSKEALSEFIEIRGGGKHFLEIGLKEIYEKVSSLSSLESMEGAREVLNALSQNNLLALVTVGEEKRQRAKLRSTGIDTTTFSKIIVCAKPNKGLHYRAITQEFRVEASEVIVCGDRIKTDLEPAKELGFLTVHIRRGRGESEPRSHSAVDVTISHLSELHEIVGAILRRD